MPQHKRMHKHTTERIVVGAIVFAIVSLIVHTVGATLAMSYYTEPANFPLWSNLMMPGPSPPGIDFYAASLVSSFVIGAIFAYAYVMLKHSIPGTSIRKGMNYGVLLFFLAAVPYTFASYLILAVPTGLLVDWAVENLVIYLIGGAVFGKLIK